MSEFTVTVTVSGFDADMKDDSKSSLAEVLTQWAEESPPMAVTITDDHSESVIAELVEAIREICEPVVGNRSYAHAIALLRKYGGEAQ